MHSVVTDILNDGDAYDDPELYIRFGASSMVEQLQTNNSMNYNREYYGIIN